MPKINHNRLKTLKNNQRNLNTNALEASLTKYKKQHENKQKREAEIRAKRAAVIRKQHQANANNVGLKESLSKYKEQVEVFYFNNCKKGARIYFLRKQKEGKIIKVLSPLPGLKVKDIQIMLDGATEPIDTICSPEKILFVNPIPGRIARSKRRKHKKTKKTKKRKNKKRQTKK